MSFLAVHHVMWRDEVRALSLALDGSNVVEMLQRIHGEGHPAVWYLLLRGAHAIFPSPVVLAATALAVGGLAVILLVFRSRLPLPLLIVVIVGQPFVYEYSVMARNYGISALWLFALALLVRRNYTGVWIGVLLFLLVNSNVHSVLLAGAFVLFQIIEAIRHRATLPAAEWRALAVNCVIAAIGVGVCVLTIYPPYNDAAVSHRHVLTFHTIATAIFLPALSFPDLFPAMVRWKFSAAQWHVLGSVIMFGSTLALIRSFSAWLAALVALVMLSLFFRLIYGGGYRHEALWPVFLLTMYWIAGHDRAAWNYGPVLEPFVVRLRQVGIAAMMLLFVLQVVLTIQSVTWAAIGLPESRSADLAALVDRNPRYRSSWIIADPDALVEAVPYYLSNPTYLLREHRPGNVVIYTEHAQLVLTLDDIVARAASLRRASNHPVLILLRVRLTPTMSSVLKEGYDWRLVVTPANAQRFLAATRRLARFGGASGDETFDVYVLE